ncbi:alpha-N-acetylgalactosaminidase-like [Chironomus tepperi]|uniref:alpha-N-acetylgalactosaminidase-like n=1 Tax=Chironomus tepperi TaxID=113505 RepID=UPI00391F55B9
MTIINKNLLSLVCTVFLLSTVRSLDNGLAKTPPMGWMSWERFRCITDCDKYPDECISERLFIEMADIMVNEGYLAAGYEYVNIDDCWTEMERENGKIVPDKKRFPHGVKYLSDYIHSKGLKIGTYLDYGTKTCAGYPGTLGFEATDAQSLADWEVDFIKLDGCNIDTSVMVDGYIEFGKMMNKTGRPIMYSCSWPAYFEYYRRPTSIPDYDILVETCNLWRNYVDIDDSYESVLFIADYFANNSERLIPYAGPGHWNDPDTLLLGNFGLSYEQSKAQLAIWAILAAPFLLSTDLRTITPEIKELILNREIIAIDQDKLGIQGKRLSSINRIETWIRPVSPIVNNEYSYAVAFVSRRTDGHGYAFEFSLEKLGLTNFLGYEVKDLFDSKRETFKISLGQSLEDRVNPTGANFYKLTPITNRARR